MGFKTSTENHRFIGKIVHHLKYQVSSFQYQKSKTTSTSRRAEESLSVAAMDGQQTFYSHPQPQSNDVKHHFIIAIDIFKSNLYAGSHIKPPHLSKPTHTKAHVHTHTNTHLINSHEDHCLLYFQSSTVSRCVITVGLKGNSIMNGRNNFPISVMHLKLQKWGVN